MSHEVIMFLPEEHRESTLIQFLNVGNTGDMEEQFTEAVLVNKTNTPITVLRGGEWGWGWWMGMERF